jgi:hypothetical protein
MTVALDERGALDVIAIRALETTDGQRTLWTDADRAWASRAAAEVVGEGGTPEAFLAQRARLALGRAGERFKALPRAVRSLRWRPWVGTVVVAAAFVAGVTIDRIGDAQRINVLAPPVLAVLAWNLAVYALLAVGFVVHYGDAVAAGPLRRAVAAFAGGLLKPRGQRDGELGAAVAQVAGDWARVSGPLHGARATRVLHLAAAALAAGLLAGLYLRGLAFEYRASWESTFLDAGSVRRLLAIAFAPGAALTGMPVPSVADVEAIRAPAGENAARWLHLMAATVVVVVIVPRLLLALYAWLVERYRSTHLALALALDEPYFQRLLRGFSGGPARVRIVPYSYALPPAATAAIERLVARAFGGGAAITIAAPVRYGDESESPPAAAARPDTAGTVIALFNATATPERETHGAFVGTLAAQAGPAGTLVALIDEGPFRAHWQNEPERLEARRASWRALCSDRRVPCAFADLLAPDVADAAAALERALEEAAR